MWAYVRILRLKQWIKNLLIFCPLFFSGNFANQALLGNVVIAFFIFSIAASGIYCFNDACDVEKDRKHPSKRNRPVAKGEIPVATAYCMAAVLCVAALAASFLLLSAKYAGLIAGYICLNLLYSLWLKKVVLLDVAILASFYVMRLFAGDIVTDCHLSHWIIIVTFVAAFMIGMGKRRVELVSVLESGADSRAALRGYDLRFVDMSLVLSAGATFMCYVMYTVSAHPVSEANSDNLFWTSIVLFIAILRYMQIVIAGKKGEDPSELFLEDLPLALCFVVWVTMFVVLLYF